MLILDCALKLGALRTILHRKLPESIFVYGGLVHIMNNNRCHLEMCVDSWPNFSTVICRRQKQALAALPNLCTLLTKDVASMKMMLMDDRVIDWKQDLLMTGIPSCYGGLLKEIGISNGMEVKYYDSLKLFVKNDPWNVQFKENDLESKISSLNVSHAELVYRQLSYGGHELIQSHVRSCIQNLPSSCILDEEGNPVSWLLMDEFYSLRMGFSMPEYRKHGYMKTVTATLINEANSLGLPVFGNVHKTNAKMIQLMKCMGFTPHSEEYVHLLISAK
ncbi:glycine N-acyltransferase-like protein 3 [Amia ocellicauda]|uniref:glycine N-acyltransferase-like protein 3 n=1 Tax=Amia ocellicauda TaxID=2972642 RepID=UPI003463DAA8